MRKKYKTLKKELSHYKQRLNEARGTIEKQYLTIAVRHIKAQINHLETNYYIQK